MKLWIQVGALFLLSCGNLERNTTVQRQNDENKKELLAFYEAPTFSVEDYFFDENLNDQVPIRFSELTVVKEEGGGFQSFSSTDFYLISQGRGITELSNDTLHIKYKVLRNAQWNYVEFFLTPFRFVDPKTVNINDTIMHINSKLYVKTKYDGKKVRFADLSKYKREWLVPKKEKNLLIVKKEGYEIFFFKEGELVEKRTVCLGQNSKGHKAQEGDNRTPEGHYFISQKAKGPFYNSTGPYLGNSWMRVSYPNAFDAEKGFQKGYITKQQRNSIVNSFWSKRQPLENTKLGGGIGLHGWYGEWEETGQQDMTWGCVCMHNHEIDELYPKIPVGTTLLIVP